MNVLLFSAVLTILTADDRCTLSGTLMVTDAAGRPFKPEAAEVYVSSGLSVPPRRRQLTMFQEGLKFSPRVLVVERDDVVAFENRDAVLHEIHCDAKSNTFMSERNEKRVTSSREFVDLGVSHLGCHVHPKMAAIILTVPNRFHSRVDDEGKWSIEGLPRKSIELSFWEANGRSLTKRVTACETRTVDVTIEKASPPVIAPYGGTVIND